MAATLNTVEPSTRQDPVFLTGRELVVLAVALGLVVSTLLLFVVASGQVSAALFGQG